MKNKILATCLAVAVLLQSSVMLIGAAETEAKSVDAESDVVVVDSEEESTPDMEQEESELSEPETDPIQSDIEVEIIEIPNENASLDEETTIEDDDANQEPPVVEESLESSSEEPEEIPNEEETVNTDTESGEEITEEPNANVQEVSETTETLEESLEVSESSEETDAEEETTTAETQTVNEQEANLPSDLENAVEISIFEYTVRTIGTDPAMDIVKFVAEESGFFWFAFSSEAAVEFEVLDENGNIFTGIKSDSLGTYIAYYLEEGRLYYVRVTGYPDTDYAIQSHPCLQNAIVYDFANDTEGFTCGSGATGSVEDGMLKIAINKSVSLSKAYVQNSDLDLDLFDYSRLIIRMKNTTNTTNLSGTVGIDLEYDGSFIDYSLDSAMAANMAGFENIEFDFTTRYGNVNSLKLSFGQLLSSLSGDIYIDFIAVLPMPNVLAWEFEENMESWTHNEQIDSATVENGELVLDMLGTVPGMAPAITSPGTSAYDFDKYNVIKIGLKNETPSNSVHVYFTTMAEGHTTFDENKKFVQNIIFSNHHTEYTFNLYEHALFTDSLKDIMISIPEEGTVSIDYIRLYKYEPFVYHDVIWEFEEDLDGFSSFNEKHTLNSENGALEISVQNIESGGFYSPSNLDLPTSEYRYLILGVNSASSTSDFHAYFKTSNMTSFHENNATNKTLNKHVLQIEKSETFREYVIDLSYAQQGWTSNYTGDLEQFMFALTTPGTYEIEYMKLVKGNANHELSINAIKDNEYKIFISKNNNHTIGTYTLEYDATAFELIDACAYTFAQETEPGQALGTDITISSVSDGSVTFKVSDKTVAGAINCLKFKALDDLDATFTITTSVN